MNKQQMKAFSLLNEELLNIIVFRETGFATFEELVNDNSFTPSLNFNSDKQYFIGRLYNAAMAKNGKKKKCDFFKGKRVKWESQLTFEGLLAYTHSFKYL